MGNHLFSTTDLMSLLLPFCFALLFYSLLSPLLSHFNFVLCPHQISHTPLFAGFCQPSTLVFCLSHNPVLSPTSSWPLQALRLFYMTWAVFFLMFIMSHLWLQCQSVCFHIIRNISQQGISINNLTRCLERTVKNRKRPPPFPPALPSSRPTSPTPCPDELIHLQPWLMA